MAVETMEAWRRTGKLRVFHYADKCERELSYNLISDAQTYEDYPDATQPALILHGTAVTVVPITYSQRFVSEHPAAKLLQFSTGHEMTDSLDALWNEVSRFLVPEY